MYLKINVIIKLMSLFFNYRTRPIANIQTTLSTSTLIIDVGNTTRPECMFNGNPYAWYVFNLFIYVHSINVAGWCENYLFIYFVALTSLCVLPTVDVASHPV